MIEFDEEKHIYTLDGEKIPGVTEILSPITSGEYGKINPAVLEHAAMKGTLVHEWCEMYDYGCADEQVPAELVGYCQAYMDFVRDYRPNWKSIERIVYYDSSGTDLPLHKYAGRLDRFGLIDNHWAVVDIKTISSPTTKTHISVCCQTIAYALALAMEHEIFEEGFLYYRYALYLKPDGTYRLFDCREFERKQDFFGIDLFFDLLDVKEEIDRIGRKK